MATDHCKHGSINIKVDLPSETTSERAGKPGDEARLRMTLHIQAGTVCCYQNRNKSSQEYITYLLSVEYKTN